MKIIIIGAGIGGLFTGAFLAKEGYEVTVLEKNAIIGGGLQCFTRKGEMFETGMHSSEASSPAAASARYATTSAYSASSASCPPTAMP